VFKTSYHDWREQLQTTFTREQKLANSSGIWKILASDSPGFSLFSWFCFSDCLFFQMGAFICHIEIRESKENFTLKCLW